MEIVNCCPHPLPFYDAEGNLVTTYTPSRWCIRCAEERIEIPDHPTGARVFKVYYRLDMGTMPPEPDAPQAWIMSQIAAHGIRDLQKATGKYSNVTLLYPGDLVRDEKGFIIGNKGFILYHDEEFETCEPTTSSMDSF